jgi:hypothetical protein
MMATVAAVTYIAGVAAVSDSYCSSCQRGAFLSGAWQPSVMTTPAMVLWVAVSEYTLWSARWAAMGSGGPRCRTARPTEQPNLSLTAMLNGLLEISWSEPL